MTESSLTISSDRFDAVLFDMDGVVTRTAVIHFKAWKSVFDAFLKSKKGNDFEPFTQSDYLDYVDGKPREEGVKSFLQARNILPAPDRAPEAGQSFDSIDSIDSIAKEKDAQFMHLVHSQGVEAYETTVALIRKLKTQGIAVGLVTASKNGEEVLRIAHLSHLFDTTVTGVDAANQKLAGKPQPDSFLEAARRLSVSPGRAVVVEDAEAGVQAGKAGHFGMVIGVARQGNLEQLRAHGASDVVRDLSEVDVSGCEKTQHFGTAFSEMDVTDKNWIVEYNSYDPHTEMQRESLCSLGNGKFCTRGAGFESRQDGIHYPGTYVAGGYNLVKSKSQSHNLEREEIVNWPNWLYLTFKLEGDEKWFSLDSSQIISYSKRLNLKEGVLYRDIQIEDHRGRQTQISEKRFVHMQYSHMAGLECTLTPINWSGKLTIRSAIDGTVTNSGEFGDASAVTAQHFTTKSYKAGDDIICMKATTTTTRFVVAEAVRTSVQVSGIELKSPRQLVQYENFVGQDIHFFLNQNEDLRIEKILTLYTSRDKGVFEAKSTALEEAARAQNFATLIEAHIEAWKSLWQQFDLFIETAEEFSKLVPSLLLHLNSFHCLQAASTHTVDLDCGLPARGWTGEGYQGHVFWDDLFVFPFINLRLPNISAALLKYRYRRLNQARLIAQAYGARGACFPWQSASDGRERTPSYWWLESKQQWLPDYSRLEIHVNGAIAYNIWQYFQVTYDTSFMYSYGSEIILEIARFFATFAKYNEDKGRFEIRGIIGPDEFHSAYPHSKKPGINNNTYTNIMAVWTLQRALQVLDKIPHDHKDHICRRLNITDQEIELWKAVASKMFVPLMSSGIVDQFEGYEQLDEFPGFKDNKIDLDEMKRSFADNLGYFNQYKICKQADVLMLGFLFSQKELNDLIESLGYPASCLDLGRIAEYFIPRTSNESTLSRVALTWVLSRLKRKSPDLSIPQSAVSAADETQKQREKPEDNIFYAALGSDYYDVAARGTTKYGIHMGAMAGTVDIVQRCYTGIVTTRDVLIIDPHIPEELVRLIFNIHYRGQSLSFNITHDKMTIEVRHSSAQPIKLQFRDEVFELNAGQTKVVSLSNAPSD